ncbi:MAG: hypothetical protein AAF465_04305 [Pseudomonadota bacterium]
MIKSAAAFLLGLAAGAVYLMLGAKYIGWNALYGYGPRLIEWTLLLQAEENLLGGLIYVHDVLIFLVLAIVLSVLAVKLLASRLVPLFTVGVVLATLTGSSGLLVSAELSISWVSAVVIVLIPLPVLITIRKLFVEGAVNAA